MNRDYLNFIIKAANISGYLEAEEKIEVHGWEPLEEFIIKTVDTYLHTDNMDVFWDIIEEGLIQEFKPRMKM